MKSPQRFDRVIAAVVAIAAVATIASAVVVIKQSNRIDSIERRIGSGSLDQVASEANNDAHNKHFTMISDDKQSHVDGVLTDKGTGFLTGGNLKDPSSGHVYQLWADVPTPVSLGLIGEDASASIAFRMPDGASKVYVTEEAKAGSATPGAPVVSSMVPA